jgi:hypothetical protein
MDERAEDFAIREAMELIARPPKKPYRGRISRISRVPSPMAGYSAPSSTA